MNFDEESIYKTSASLKKIMLSHDKHAKDFFFFNKYVQKDDDILLLNELGRFSLEGKLVHVRCIVFNSKASCSMIRVASLVESCTFTGFFFF